MALYRDKQGNFESADISDLDFRAWAVRRGHQRFFQPLTVAPEMANEFGWIDAPTSGSMIIPLYELPGDAEKTMYWFYESIVSRSSQPIRMALEGNRTWTPEGGFDPAGWRIDTGYNISSGQDHQLSGVLIKTAPGEAIRLRVYGALGNNNDFYFKYIGFELPWLE